MCFGYLNISVYCSKVLLYFTPLDTSSRYCSSSIDLILEVPVLKIDLHLPSSLAAEFWLGFPGM